MDHLYHGELLVITRGYPMFLPIQAIPRCQPVLVLDIQHEEIIELLFVVPSSEDIYTTSRRGKKASPQIKGPFQGRHNWAG